MRGKTSGRGLFCFNHMSVLAEQMQELMTAVERLSSRDRPTSVDVQVPGSPVAGSSRLAPEYQPMPITSETDAPAPLTPFGETFGESTAAVSDDVSSSELVVRRRKRSSSRPAVLNPKRMWGAKMLSMIPWAARFFCGPKDPVNHPYSAHCLVCQADVSVWSKGHNDIIRHWKRDKHFRREQKFRDENGMDVLDRQRNVLVGHKLELERREFETCPLIELGERYPLHVALAEEAPIAVDLVERQTRLQLEVGFLSFSVPLCSLLCCPYRQGRRAACQLPSHSLGIFVLDQTPEMG